MLKLNLGCGLAKFEGYVNVDVEESVAPDLLINFAKVALPYQDGEVDEIVLFHTIEHIEKPIHPWLFKELRRVLKVGGRLIVSYPHFWICAKYWRENYLGMRDFWHMTLYGRQTYKSDYHVCAMDPVELEQLLSDCGFSKLKSFPETAEDFNYVTVGYAIPFMTYRDMLVKDFEESVVK
jgi:hypothetical protein